MLYHARPEGQSRIPGIYQARRPHRVEIEPLDITPQLSAPEQLEQELIQRGVTALVAQELVRDYPEEKVRAQIERLDWLIEKKPEKIAEPAAYLVQAIKNGYAAPKGFISKAERQRRQEAKQAREREAAEERRRQQEEEARERAMRKAINAHWASLTPEQQAELDAASIAQADPDTLAMEKRPDERHLPAYSAATSTSGSCWEAGSRPPPTHNLQIPQCTSQASGRAFRRSLDARSPQYGDFPSGTAPIPDAGRSPATAPPGPGVPWPFMPDR